MLSKLKKRFPDFETVFDFCKKNRIRYDICHPARYDEKDLYPEILCVHRNIRSFGNIAIKMRNIIPEKKYGKTANTKMITVEIIYFNKEKYVYDFNSFDDINIALKSAQKFIDKIPMRE